MELSSGQGITTEEIEVFTMEGDQLWASVENQNGGRVKGVRRDQTRVHAFVTPLGWTLAPPRWFYNLRPLMLVGIIL